MHYVCKAALSEALQTQSMGHMLHFFVRLAIQKTSGNTVKTTGILKLRLYNK